MPTTTAPTADTELTIEETTTRRRGLTVTELAEDISWDVDEVIAALTAGTDENERLEEAISDSCVLDGYDDGGSPTISWDPS
jgi:hypothetical protein